MTGRGLRTADGVSTARRTVGETGVFFSHLLHLPSLCFFLFLITANRLATASLPVVRRAGWCWGHLEGQNAWTTRNDGYPLFVHTKLIELSPNQHCFISPLSSSSPTVSDLRFPSCLCFQAEVERRAGCMKRVTGNNRPGLVTTAGRVTGQEKTNHPKKEKTGTKKRKARGTELQTQTLQGDFFRGRVAGSNPLTQRHTNTHASTHM
jgi:hypothetical protein